MINQETKSSLKTEFFDIFDRFKNVSLANMYQNIFSLLSDKEFFNMLINMNILYKEDKVYWFYNFHKLLRQGDFFTSLHLYRTENHLTEEQSNRRYEIISKRQVERSTGKHHSEEDYKELRDINSLLRVQVDIEGINGMLDMLLWNLIHLDTENELSIKLTVFIKNNNLECLEEL